MIIKIIEPYYRDKRYDIRSSVPSLGPIIVASLLKKNGHKVEVQTEYVSELDFDEINSADLVGISITTYNATRGYEIAQRIRKPVVFGGFHASLLPEECLNYGSYVIRGDGHSIVELADVLSGGKIDGIREVPNLVYRTDGRVFYNKQETKSINIVPDFSLVKDYYKLNLNRLLRIPLLVNASRGCHFNCTFCSIKPIYPDFKKKDKGIVIEDIKSQLRNQHFFSKFLPRIIWITDDNFFSDKDWAKDLLRELIRLKTGYRFVIQARLDIANDDNLLKLIEKANIGMISLGIESLNQLSLDSFNKGSSVKDIGVAVDKIKSHGIDVHGLFVFGDDEFKKGDGLKVAEFVKHHHLSGLLIQPLTPYPGTPLFKRLDKEGRILHKNWEDYNGKVVFVPKRVSAAELHKEIYDCYRSIYSPFRVLKFLIFGKNGFRLIIFGIAIFRYIEWLKSKNYIREKLSKGE